ncbi:hypothetical protein CHS0354_023446 [Potamilus streckersoni]|uniref:Uncharacterized protein n=1 Tax=Potamilus streckersoni TaxID=2493646 RepID=A0AAE0VP67_9BIVA|nr:hypothetical protein CHS0354_023446 [Potamilus streckersoni]
MWGLGCTGFCPRALRLFGAVPALPTFPAQDSNQSRSTTCIDFQRQEAAAGLLQLTVPYMESNQINVDVLTYFKMDLAQIRKRKLTSDSTSQVTEKKNKVFIGIQKTPAKQKHTQDISIGADKQTETPSSFCLKSNKTTQTDSKTTCEKSSQ